MCGFPSASFVTSCLPMPSNGKKLISFKRSVLFSARLYVNETDESTRIFQELSVYHSLSREVQLAIMSCV